MKNIKKILLTNLIILLVANSFYVFFHPLKVGKWDFELLIGSLLIFFYLIGFFLIIKRNFLQGNDFYKFTVSIHLIMATFFLLFYREIELVFNKTNLIKQICIYYGFRLPLILLFLV